MNSNEVQLIMNIFLNNDISKCFKKEIEELMSLEIIKKEAMAYFQINGQNIDSCKLTTRNNEDFKEDIDLIKFAKKDSNENLVCDIKLLSEEVKNNLNEHLSQKTGDETKEKENQ